MLRVLGAGLLKAVTGPGLPDLRAAAIPAAAGHLWPRGGIIGASEAPAAGGRTISDIRAAWLPHSSTRSFATDKADKADKADKIDQPDTTDKTEKMKPEKPDKMQTRPRTAYEMYYNEMHPILKKQFGNDGSACPSHEPQEETNGRWNELTDEEKKPYKEVAKSAPEVPNRNNRKPHEKQLISSGWLLYQKESKESIKQEMPGANSQVRLNAVAALWKALGQEQYAWNNKAKELREEAKARLIESGHF